MTYYTRHIFVCTNQKDTGKVCCANSGGKDSFHHLKLALKALDLHGAGKIRVSQSGCLGRCGLGPCLVIYPEGVWYTYQTLADIDEIISKHLILSQTVDRLLISEPLL